MPGRDFRIQLPDGVREILARLKAHGHEAYAVGGCVRDSVLGRTPGDWDITTSALPLEIKDTFRRTVDTGIEHGTVTVLLGDDSFEVTTYRVDGEYRDLRHPAKVEYTRSLAEDLTRRDFTINAMAYNEEDGLIDLHQGLKDLKDGIIRCVGNADDRFNEDALRILRAVRFAAQLDFTIDEHTAAAIRRHAANLAAVSRERVLVELSKLVCSAHIEKTEDLFTLGLSGYIAPGFSDISVRHLQELKNTQANAELREAWEKAGELAAWQWAESPEDADSEDADEDETFSDVILPEASDGPEVFHAEGAAQPASACADDFDGQPSGAAEPETDPGEERQASAAQIEGNTGGVAMQNLMALFGMPGAPNLGTAPLHTTGENNKLSENDPQNAGLQNAALQNTALQKTASGGAIAGTGASSLSGMEKTGSDRTHIFPPAAFDLTARVPVTARYLRFAFLLAGFSREEGAKLLRGLKADNLTVKNASLLAELCYKPLPDDRYELKKVMCTMTPELFRELLYLKLASSETALYRERCAGEDVMAVLETFEDIRELGEPVYLQDLVLTGHDLMELGAAEGPEIGVILKRMLDAVHKDPQINTMMYLISNYYKLTLSASGSGKE